MKVIIFCSAGAVRSVTMAFCLRHTGDRDKFDVFVGALHSTSEEAIRFICTWADRIVVMESGMEDDIPMEFLEKITVCDVGPDVWKQSLHPELVAKCILLIEKNKEVFFPE